MTNANQRSRERVDTVRAKVLGERFVDLVVALGGKIRRRRANAQRVELACFMHGGSGHELNLKPATGQWVCHAGCGGGDSIELVMKALGREFQDALVWLSDWSGGAPLALVPATPEVRRVDATPLLRALWAHVERLPWTAPAQAYLASRGIDVDTAHALGCRDWSTQADAIRDLVCSFGADMIESAGLGERGQLWWPLRPGAPAGVAVPVWGLNDAIPRRWRWRMLEPQEMPGGDTLKTLSCYSAGGMVDLIGAGLPERDDDHFDSSATSHARTLLVVEGEPDWWSASQVAAGRAIVVGVCGGADRWRETWPRLEAFASTRGVERVVVMVHRGKAMLACACGRVTPAAKAKSCKCGASLAGATEKRHGEVFAESVTRAAANAGLTTSMLLPEEQCDLNDLHKQGRLSRWLARVL